MLSVAKMVGFVVTTDYDRARNFYEQTLGFDFVSQDLYALVMRTATNTIRIVRIPGFSPARNTVLGWEVTNIEDVASWLTGRGVVLEDYPFISDHERRIWTTPTGDRVAWFRDPDGNVLSISQHA